MRPAIPAGHAETPSADSRSCYRLSDHRQGMHHGYLQGRADGLRRAVRPWSSPGREMRSHRIVTFPTPSAA
ncbi:hypothetical protein SBRY_80269 [Actinacidiphila bryophytorum]|uniref:Uncharacterized protein n=1 Tax=Actinacidiphila bryophytorum TaxID=1436133 RepID=A0A9W4H7D8_9ACTN|nr:hypothetical protein SBRY_80269 [Actinacidiphila bryophytorum]